MRILDNILDKFFFIMESILYLLFYFLVVLSSGIIVELEKMNIDSLIGGFRFRFIRFLCTSDKTWRELVNKFSRDNKCDYYKLIIKFVISLFLSS